MRSRVVGALAVGLLGALARPATACDLHSLRTASAIENDSPGFRLGLAEQWTHYGTLQDGDDEIAVAVGYAFVVTVFIMKTLTLRDLPKLLINAGITTAIVMIIMGTATIWGWVLAIEQIGDKLAFYLVSFSTPFTFLLMVNIFFLLLCTFMENISAILIFAPILAPIAEQLGIHPVHFGLVFVLNTTIGLITPPLWDVLFIAAPIWGLRLDELNISIAGFFLIEVLALFVITYFPFMTLWIPELFGML